MALLGVGTTGMAAAEQDALVLKVLLQNQVALPEVPLRRAQTIAEGIYGQIGVAIVWLSPQEYDAEVRQQRGPRGVQEMSILQLVIAAQPIFEQSPSAMGLARDRRVYAWMWRIVDAAAVGRIAYDHLLGHVMAHELGHALLGTNAHTDSGLMAPYMNFGDAALSRLRFDGKQASTIRAAVRAMAATAVVRK
jgi:hypothetical protein